MLYFDTKEDKKKKNLYLTLFIAILFAGCSTGLKNTEAAKKLKQKLQHKRYV